MRAELEGRADGVEEATVHEEAQRVGETGVERGGGEEAVEWLGDGVVVAVACDEGGDGGGVAVVGVVVGEQDAGGGLAGAVDVVVVVEVGDVVAASR